MNSHDHDDCVTSVLATRSHRCALSKLTLPLKVAAAPVARGISKQTVSPEVLYKRYRGERGMELRKFVKFFRNAVLYDNSWTWGQAGLAPGQAEREKK